MSRLPALLARDAFARRVLVLFLTCVACAALLADLRGTVDHDGKEGELAERDVVAPLTFSFVNEAATRERQADAESQVAPVYEADLTVGKRLESRVSQAFDMARRRLATLPVEGKGGPDPELLAPIRADFLAALDLPLDPAEADAIVASGFAVEIEELAVELVGVALRRNVVADRSELPSPPQPVTVVNLLGAGRDEAAVDDLSGVRTPDEARQAVSLHVLERFGPAASTPKVKAAAAIGRAAVRPNFRFDATATAERRAAARDAVGAVEQKVRKGTRVVRAGDVLTSHQVRLLHAMAESDRGGGWGAFAAWAAFTGLLLGGTVFFASATIRKFPTRASDREALAFTLVLVLLVGRLLGASAAVLELPSAWDVRGVALLVPVAGGAMLVRILVNSESALVWSIVASILASAMTERSAPLAAYFVVTSLVATTGVGPARERWVVLRAGLQAGAVGAAFAVVLALLPGVGGTGAIPEARALFGLAVTALLGGAFGAVLALGVVPAFEVFGFVTDYKLLELASLNHPLLRQLMLRAPGTYHHSVIVGSLSEAACEAIGANALLARVACYFHDIGKGLKPQYFVENQIGTPNRHDRLSPAQSAQLIINHVREGAVLARQYKLPKPIYDNIFMHHGTGIIAYFHERAKELAGPGEPVDEALFRYPGPKPDTREAGIIMLADKVEAACRTIKEPSEERIRAMIQQIVNAVMNDGQLENCPLTLKELYIIADTFTTVLLGIYHHRIEYPATKAISQGKGRYVPVPRQGTITLEIVNPLKAPPPPGSGSVAPPEPDEGGPPVAGAGGE